MDLAGPTAPRTSPRRAAPPTRLAPVIEDEECDDGGAQHGDIVCDDHSSEDDIMPSRRTTHPLTTATLHTHKPPAPSHPPSSTTAPTNPPDPQPTHPIPPSTLQALHAANLFSPPAYPHHDAANPFAALNPQQVAGFMPAADTLALAAALGTQIRSTEPEPLEHSAVYAQANQPLGPGENLFQGTQQRRRDNIVGGWVARDGSATPVAEVVNLEPEPEGGSVTVGEGEQGEVDAKGGGKRRGKRGGKTKRWQRRGGLGRSGRGWFGGGRWNGGGDPGAFEDTEEYLGGEGRGLDPEANVFAPRG